MGLLSAASLLQQGCRAGCHRTARALGSALVNGVIEHNHRHPCEQQQQHWCLAPNLCPTRTPCVDDQYAPLRRVSQRRCCCRFSPSAVRPRCHCSRYRRHRPQYTTPRGSSPSATSTTMVPTSTRACTAGLMFRRKQQYG
jgi:hypothetical protein